MLRYIIKRIIFAIPVLIGATFLVFTIMDLAPGDPARIILGSNATEAALASLRDSMGLNDPFLVRYGRFILGLLHGDLGTSYRNGQAVFSLIMGRLGNTVVLATSGIVFSVIIGIPVGIISAIKQYSVLDNITMFITLFLMAVPTFWFALILVIIFSLNLGWLPSSGMQHGFPDNLISLILPTLTLGCGYAALIARTTRSSVLEVVRQDYIDMARAKGLTENAVIWKKCPDSHCNCGGTELRNPVRRLCADGIYFFLARRRTFCGGFHFLQGYACGAGKRGDTGNPVYNCEPDC